jgi:hypothetical protein
LLGQDRDQGFRPALAALASSCYSDMQCTVALNVSQADFGERELACRRIPWRL